MNRIETMLHRTADGVMLADESGKVVLWNKAAERLVGFRAAEVLGRPCHEVMQGTTPSGHPFCIAGCAVGHRLGCGAGVRNFDIQTHAKGGKTIWLNVSSLPVPSRKKDRFLFAHLFRDIGRQATVQHLVNELHAVLSAPAERRAPVAESLTSSAVSSEGNAPEIPASLSLSQREREILHHLALGERTARIADVLCISTATVRNHIQHIFDKLGVHSRLEALAVAFHRTTRSS